MPAAARIAHSLSWSRDKGVRLARAIRPVLADDDEVRLAAERHERLAAERQPIVA